jgi:hypothetical protein
MKGGVIVGMQIHFDGAGKEEDSVITVGGYLASDDVCGQIERDWERATDGRVFHLTDFGQQSCKLGSAGWDSVSRIAFLKRLGGIVNREGAYFISVSVETGVYRAFLEASPNPHVMGPVFSGCAHVSVLAAEILLRELDLETESVAYTFEKGDREHEISYTLNELDKKQDQYKDRRSHGFLPKKTTLLQPSDLIAGTAWRVLKIAHAALPCFDNGRSRTMLKTFQRHYSGDGVTEAVFSGHDERHCFVANMKLFKHLDSITTDIFRERPHVLRDRLRASTNQGKRKKEKREKPPTMDV